MKQKSFEQFLKEEIRVDRLTPLQFSGILRAHAKYEIQTEQLRKHSVVRGGDKVRESVQRVEEYLEWIKGNDAPNTPTELLQGEAVEKGVCGRFEKCKTNGITECECTDKCNFHLY